MMTSSPLGAGAKALSVVQARSRGRGATLLSHLMVINEEYARRPHRQTLAYALDGRSREPLQRPYRSVDVTTCSRDWINSAQISGKDVYVPRSCGTMSFASAAIPSSDPTRLEHPEPSNHGEAVGWALVFSPGDGRRWPCPRSWTSSTMYGRGVLMYGRGVLWSLPQRSRARSA
jgi:hypothetical protein